MSDKRHMWSVAILQFALVFVAGLTFFSFAGEVEGKLFPVTKGTVISQVVSLDQVSTRIWGGFEKVRECEFVSLGARYVGGALPVGVPVFFEEGVKIRLEGLEEFGPWRLQLSTSQLDNIEITAVHRCHPLWLTETRFYG